MRRKKVEQLTTTHQDCPIKLQGIYIGNPSQKALKALHQILRKFPLKKLPSQFTISENGHSLKVIEVDNSGRILAVFELPSEEKINMHILLLPRT